MPYISFRRPIFLVLIVSFFLAGCGATTGSEASLEPVSNTAVSQLSAPVTEESDTQLPPPATAVPQVQQVNPVPNDTLDIALAQQAAFINVYEQVNPAVVHIGVGLGQGSGFVFDTAGHIVTNNHVVEDAQSIEVTFANGLVLPATIVGTDPSSDLAVIKVNPNGNQLTAVQIADSDALRVGQIVIAIGSPFGLESTMTTGIISALNRMYPGAAAPNGTQFQIPDIIQTDAAINPGNSGGPLLDLNGNVIGVNSAIESPVRGSSGIGYAIPANIVQAVVPQIIQNGRVEHPWLGISGGELTQEIAAEFGLAADQGGVFVSALTPGGPADAAGLRASTQTQLGDVIVGINEQTITNFDDLLGYIVQYTAVGQTIDLTIIRDGQRQTLSLTLQARPSSS